MGTVRLVKELRDFVLSIGFGWMSIAAKRTSKYVQCKAIYYQVKLLQLTLSTLLFR